MNERKYLVSQAVSAYEKEQNIAPGAFDIDQDVLRKPLGHNPQTFAKMIAIERSV